MQKLTSTADLKNQYERYHQLAHYLIALYGVMVDEKKYNTPKAEKVWNLYLKCSYRKREIHNTITRRRFGIKWQDDEQRKMANGTA